MRTIGVMAGLLALAMTACGGSSGNPPADAAAERGGGGMLGGGGHGGAGSGGAPGTGGASGHGGGGAPAGGASGGAGGSAGSGGQAGAGGAADGGIAHLDAGCQSADPCLCGRPDANSISAAECTQEKTCHAAGGVWEPYVVFLPDGGGSYGPRCQSPDGAAFDAS